VILGKKSGCGHENNILILIQDDNSVERKGDRPHQEDIITNFTKEKKYYG